MTRARLFSQSGGGANSNATISAILPSLTTANIAEIGANLYFSNARVFANIRLASINDLLDVDDNIIPLNRIEDLWELVRRINTRK